MLRTSPHAQCVPADLHEDAADFAERFLSIWEKLKSLLAKDDVERPVRERQGEGAALTPVDCDPGRHCELPRGLEHPLIEIDAGHSTVGGYPPSCESRDDTRAGGDSEHVLPGA